MILRPLDLRDRRSRGEESWGRVYIGGDAEVHERSCHRCDIQVEKVISAKAGRSDPTCTVTESEAWVGFIAESLAEQR